MTILLRPLRLTTLGLIFFSAPILLIGRPAFAQNSSTNPDNSAQNSNQGRTADNQTNAKTDRLTTAKVRRAIIADKGLSMYGHNVKIITRNGTVTLKGPVHSEDEKSKVASDAANAVSQDTIVNQLTVKQ